MFCHKCGREFERNEVFCRQCGTIKRCQQESLCSSAGERLLIEHCFERGFRCNTIVHFLGEYHEINMNIRTLERKFHQYGLRRNQGHSEHTVREIVEHEIKGPSSLLEYPHLICFLPQYQRVFSECEVERELKMALRDTLTCAALSVLLLTTAN